MDAVLNLLGVLGGDNADDLGAAPPPTHLPHLHIAFSLETMLICSAAYNSLAWVHRTSAPASSGRSNSIMWASS